METKDLFTCPECGKHRLEEVMTEVVQSSVIDTIEVVGDEVACEYGLCSYEGGEVSHYQCVDCGHVVAESVNELREFLFPE
jgi:predicted RNA-binding Zn-ribbon protein involved in translation (DUF1610 family)